MRDRRQLELPPSAWTTGFRRRLLAWYRGHARDLPWRRTRDPYQVWISEIMLQQTQVATVVDYFTRFIAAFPQLADLAAAPEEAVLRQWEGLGYYRRARQLHRAAQVLMNEHGGLFPTEIEAVRRLPGIGRYTAGAILSIAYDRPHAIVEANTLRLYSRLLGYRGATHDGPGQRLLWQFAERLLPRKGAGGVNQALMELGATVCTPREPACELCPVADLCTTRRLGLQGEIPQMRPKPVIEAVREAAVVVWQAEPTHLARSSTTGRVLLLKRRDGERWAGMWDFPRFPLAASKDIVAAGGSPAKAKGINARLRDELRREVKRLTGFAIRPGQKLATIKHGVTRFRITLDCYEASLAHSSTTLSSEMRWVCPSEFNALPLSTTGRRLCRVIQDRIAVGLGDR